MSEGTNFDSPEDGRATEEISATAAQRDFQSVDCQSPDQTVPASEEVVGTQRLNDMQAEASDAATHKIVSARYDVAAFRQRLVNLALRDAKAWRERLDNPTD